MMGGPLIQLGCMSVYTFFSTHKTAHTAHPSSKFMGIFIHDKEMQFSFPPDQSV